MFPVAPVTTYMLSPPCLLLILMRDRLSGWAHEAYREKPESGTRKSSAFSDLTRRLSRRRNHSQPEVEAYSVGLGQARFTLPPSLIFSTRWFVHDSLGVHQ